MAARHPTRLALYSENDKKYPRELLELDGKLYFVGADGKIKILNPSGKIIIKDKDGNIIGEVDPTTGGTITFPDASTLIADSGVEAAAYGPTENASPAHGETFVVPQLTVNAKGFVTGAVDRVITLPSTAAHPTITMATNTTSNATPKFGSTFTAIDSITKDANGHVTKVNTKTITLKKPSTTYTVNVNTAWTGSAAPYSKSVTVTGLTASDTPIVDVVLSSTYATAQTQLENFSKIFRAVTGANTLTLYSNAKTTGTITLQIKVV